MNAISTYPYLRTYVNRAYNFDNRYYSTIASFYHIRAKERTKYATFLHCRTGQKYGLKAERQNCRTKLYFLVE